MSWSLTLSPRLSPAVWLGVSEETPSSFPTSTNSMRSPDAVISELTSAAAHNFPEQLSAPCGACLALGVPATRKELPITAA